MRPCRLEVEDEVWKLELYVSVVGEEIFGFGKIRERLRKSVYENGRSIQGLILETSSDEYCLFH